MKLKSVNKLFTLMILQTARSTFLRNNLTSLSFVNDDICTDGDSKPYGYWENVVKRTTVPYNTEQKEPQRLAVRCRVTWLY
jgi:hypothetical protein